MNKRITKKEVISSLFWKLMERGGSQGISFVVSIVLARILLPEEYGLIALIMIFISLANVFVQGGFNSALIQKKDADDIDFSTVFYISLFIAGLLYIVLFFSAPSIARFYEQLQLIAVIRVLSITLFFGTVNSIQIAVISRNMQFKKLFYSSFGAIIASGIVGIIMAYKGFGVWALVAQQIINQLFSTLIMWFTVKWRPKLLFSFKRLQGLLSFGWKILVSNLINTLFLNLRSLIIGKIYSADMLGYFNRGKQFPLIIITNVNGSIQSVMLPAYSSEQGNRKRVKDMVRRSITTSSFIVFPIMVGLAIVSKPLVTLVLTDKWLPCVPFLQIFCATYMLMPIHTANLQAIKALGYSGKILKIELIKKILELTVLIISLNYGIYAIAVGGLIASLISLVINSYPNIELLNYSYKEQLKDVTPSLMISIVMGIVVYSIEFIGVSVGLTLLIQIFVGIISYFGLALFFKLESFSYLINTFSSIFCKNLD
jgi:O-antigen/teichoic acid export membrane protein